MAKSKLNIEEEISRCVNQLLLKEPFYAHVLAGTIRKVDDTISTAAVGLNKDLIMLMVNEDFFLKELKSASERVAVLKHEVLHLVFKHLFRHKATDDPELFNIAADLVVNQYIGSWKLPETAVTLESFRDLNLQKEQHLEYYYDKLYQLHKNKKKSKNSAVENGNSSDTESENTENDKTDTQYPISSQKLKEIYNKKRHSDHSKWILKDRFGNSISSNKPVESNMISSTEQMIEKQLLTALDRIPVKYYGSIPLKVMTLLSKIKEDYKPKVDWKRVLKIFNSSAGRTEIYHTNKRISKRFGTRPGVKIVQKRKVAVVIDTSGSIDRNTLLLFFSEIHNIYTTGTQILIIECDAAVGQVYPYRKNTEIKISGGGGTSYDPAFEYINKNRNIRIDACIYLTDGYAPKPVIKPRCKLLYVITPDGNTGDHLVFGKSIKMNKQ